MHLVDYFSGRYSWRELANLVEGFDLQRKSWLTWARVNDLEVIRSADAAGQLPDPAPERPETFDFGLVEELLAGLVAHAQAEANPGERVRPLSPRTGMDVVRAERANRAYHDILDLVQLVPQAEYDEFCREVGPQL